MSKFKKIILVILFVLLIIIIIQNTDIVSFHLLFWPINFPKYVLPIIIIVCIAIGYFLAGLFRSGGHKKD